MKKYVYLIVLTTALLIAAVLLCVFQINTQSFLPFSIEVCYGNSDETISLWKNANNDMYAFLPAGIDLSQAKLHLNEDSPVYIDGERLEEAADCSPYILNQAHELEYKRWGRICRTNITFLQAESVAAMYIDTASGTMEYIHAQKGNEESGSMRLYLADGTLDCSGEVASINGRGNYSWDNFEKKPYSLCLAEPLNLLNMGAAQKWILLSNGDDPSNMRNKIVFDFAKTMKLAYSPESCWVDLYLNSEYMGLYLLSERNEVHTERVNINENNSFLVSLEREDRLLFQNYPYIETKLKQALRIHHPSDITKDIVKLLQEKWQSVENALVTENGIDSLTEKQWSDLIDVNSWIKKYLIEEIFCSGDSCFISQFFYAEDIFSDSKIYAGPVWDFDHSIGSAAAWQLKNPTGFYANRLHVKNGFETPWFYNLYQKKEFYEELTTLYTCDFLPQIEYIIDTQIYQYVFAIDASSSMNQIRWNIEQDIFSEAEYMKTYLSERTAFLSKAWIERASFYQVRLDQGFGAFYGYFAVESGQCLSETPVLEDSETMRFVGWYREDTNEPFDCSQPIYEDVKIYAKWENKPSRVLGYIWKLIPFGIISAFAIAILCIDVHRAKR